MVVFSVELPCYFSSSEVQGCGVGVGVRQSPDFDLESNQSVPFEGDSDSGHVLLYVQFCCNLFDICVISFTVKILLVCTLSCTFY